MAGIFDYDKVICFFASDEIEKIRFLRTGDTVKIKGIVGGALLGCVIMKGCVIVD